MRNRLALIAIAIFLCLFMGGWDSADRPFQIPLNGRWLPNVNPLHVGVENYTELKNLRYTDTGLETVEGFTILTGGIPTGAYELFNGFHFRKEDESHLMLKYRGGSSSSGPIMIIQNQTAIPEWGNYDGVDLSDNDAETATLSSGMGSFSDGPEGTMLYADDTSTLIWGGDQMGVASVLVSQDANALTPVDGTEYVNNDITTEDITVAGSDYIFIGSPLLLDRIYLSVSSPNTTTSSMSGSVWVSTGWLVMTIGDGTSSGGVSLAQTGSISLVKPSSTPAVRYLQGSSLYWYRFRLSAGTADIYKVQASAPIQSVKDVWNKSGRVCTSFQADRSNVYEDYTYRVNDQSTQDTPYAATIGGLGASDSIYLMFDDRVMGVDVKMLGSLVNSASAYITSVNYWDGASFASVNGLSDFTRSGTASFARSGTISWTAPAHGVEQPRHDFSKYGYVYKIDLSGTLTDGTDHDGTSVDYLTGIAAPVKTTGYDKVGFYSGRVMLIKKNQVDYSLPNTPWVYNGVNTSNIGSPKEAPLFFGDENPITSTASLFNRYGSNIIENWVVTKQSETYLLSGSQPYSDYGEGFVIKTISKSLGCPAPMTMKNVEIGFEVEGQAKRNAIVWLDSTGPVLFDGAVLSPLAGIENYFDPNNSECIKYSLIHEAVAYVDTVASEYNLIFPSGSAAATNNKWVVYSLKHKKWYEKDAFQYPVLTIPVKDTDGAKYNYMHAATHQLFRLDHGQNWNGTAIDQEIVTGEFSPPVADKYGLWTQSELSAVKLISNAITEDRDVTINFYGDGVLSATSLTIPLDVSGTLSRNTAGDRAVGILNYTYKVKFATSSSSDKWEPLVWGYKARMIRED